MSYPGCVQRVLKRKYCSNHYTRFSFLSVFAAYPSLSEVKASASKAGDPDSIPGLGRSPGEGNGNLLQHSCLKHPMDRDTWGRKESDRTEQLSMHVKPPQLCWTLWNPMDCSLSGSSAHRILQTRILEGVSMPFSRRSSWPRDRTRVSCGSCIAGKFLPLSPQGKPRERPSIHYQKGRKW